MYQKMVKLGVAMASVKECKKGRYCLEYSPVAEMPGNQVRDFS